MIADVSALPNDEQERVTVESVLGSPKVDARELTNSGWEEVREARG